MCYTVTTNQQFMQYPHISIGYHNMFISNTSDAKLLGLVTTNSLCWTDHITQVTPKLCKVCYVLRCIRLFMSQDTLKSVYYPYFHSLITYGIIFWGNSSKFSCLVTSKEGK